MFQNVLTHAPAHLLKHATDSDQHQACVVISQPASNSHLHCALDDMASERVLELYYFLGTHAGAAPDLWSIHAC